MAGRQDHVVGTVRPSLLPVVEGLASLLPERGIRRGATVGVSGSTSLAFALGARASAAGGWCAAVGFRALGLVAIAELGYDMTRLALADAGEPLAWARAVSALLDPCDVVLARPPAPPVRKTAEQLTARARERGAVLVVAEGGAWPGRLDLTLTVTRSEWIGVERGAGRLRARRVEVEVSGRGAASLARRSALWLPGERGEIAPADMPEVGLTRAAR